MKSKIPPKLILLTLILLRKCLSGAVRFHLTRTRVRRLAAVIIGLSAEPSQLVTIGQGLSASRRGEFLARLVHRLVLLHLRGSGADPTANT